MMTAWLLQIYIRTRRNLFIKTVFLPQVLHVTPCFTRQPDWPHSSNTLAAHTPFLPCQRPPCCISLSVKTLSKDSVTQISHWTIVFSMKHKKGLILFLSDSGRPCLEWAVTFGAWFYGERSFLLYRFQPKSLRWVQTKSYIHKYLKMCVFFFHSHNLLPKYFRSQR